MEKDHRKARSQIDRNEWGAYLEAFHARFPGITEEILGAARCDGINPYAWLLEVVPSDVSLLDLACGSAPLLSAGWSGPWVGLDRSEAELELASRHGDHAFIPGEANNLPFDDGSVGAVACSMALMLLDPLHDCLREVGRVLAPGGVMVVLLPGGPRALTPADLQRWTRLLLRLRRSRLAYPNDHAIAHLRKTLSGTGLDIVSDERRRFAYAISDEAMATRFVDSLYLPRVSAERVDAARRLVATWTGGAIGIPLRRIVLSRTG